MSDGPYNYDAARKAKSIQATPEPSALRKVLELLTGYPADPSREVGPLELLATAPLFGAGKKALGAGEAALDMSHAARMGRAQEMGFDTSRELYHGTSYDVPAFAPGGRRSVYLTDKPEIADIYAYAQDRHKMGPPLTAGPNVMPLYAKARKPLVVSDLGPDGGNGWSGDNMAAALGVENPGTGRALYDEARRQGYDIVEIRDMSDLGGRQTQFIPLRPENVRSRFAAFDPSKSDSADLLATLALLAGGGAVANGARER